MAAEGDDLIAFRRELHAHPELSWEEHRTSAAIRERLERAGLTPRGLTTDTGLSVDLGTGGDGPTVLLRADIDALPLDDEKDVPYRSTVDGVCHACGHDVHTTAVLGAALALAPLMQERPGRVRVLFQPAEEAIPGGASVLYDTPVMDDVDVVYALHCDPGLPVGQVGLKSGPITSAADRVIIRLKGPGGHTARPHLSVDLLAIARPHHHRAAGRSGPTHRLPSRRLARLRRRGGRSCRQRDPHPRRAAGHAAGPRSRDLGRRRPHHRTAGRGGGRALRRDVGGRSRPRVAAGRQRLRCGRRARRAP